MSVVTGETHTILEYILNCESELRQEAELQYAYFIYIYCYNTYIRQYK